MSDTLEVKKENVKKAAKKCGTAKEVLEELFPEAFEDGSMYIEEFKVDMMDDKPIFIGNFYAPEEFRKKCFVLNNRYEWEFTKNKEGMHVLIPRKK